MQLLSNVSPAQGSVSSGRITLMSMCFFAPSASKASSIQLSTLLVHRDALEGFVQPDGAFDIVGPDLFGHQDRFAELQVDRANQDRNR
jgi:hypothetical protein